MELGQDERAVRLFACTEKERKDRGSPMPPVYQETSDAEVATLRERLSPEEYEAARAAGHDMDLEGAIAYMLEWRL